MSIFSLFSRLKGLSPVAVVGTAVAITVKLLTTQTPTTEETFNVQAEEDIKATFYEDEIKEPEPEPEPVQEEEQKPDDQTSQEEEADAEETSDSEGDTESEPKEPPESQEQKPPEEKPKTKPRRWKTSKDNKLVDLFSRLLSKGKK